MHLWANIHKQPTTYQPTSQHGQSQYAPLTTVSEAHKTDQDGKLQCTNNVFCRQDSIINTMILLLSFCLQGQDFYRIGSFPEAKQMSKCQSRQNKLKSE